MSDSDKKFIHGPVADPHIVRQLTNHLLKTYDNFINNFYDTKKGLE